MGSGSAVAAACERGRTRRTPHGGGGSSCRAAVAVHGRAALTAPSGVRASGHGIDLPPRPSRCAVPVSVPSGCWVGGRWRARPSCALAPVHAVSVVGDAAGRVLPPRDGGTLAGSARQAAAAARAVLAKLHHSPSLHCRDTGSGPVGTQFTSDSAPPPCHASPPVPPPACPAHTQ